MEQIKNIVRISALRIKEIRVADERILSRV